MADELSQEDDLQNEVQSCKESSPQQTNILKQVKNILSNICHPYSRDYDDLDQCLYIIFYLNAIVLIFIILFTTKELSLGKDSGVTSDFVQERYVDILLIFYMTPAILWTACLFLIKGDTHVLVFDSNSVSYKRSLFYSLYVLGAGLFLTDILQVSLHVRCGILADSVRGLYLCVEATFVLTQLVFQVLFLNASFLAGSSAKLAVTHMIGTNISVFIHGIFRKFSQAKKEDHIITSYCNQTENALNTIMDAFQPLNLQFIVITLVTLIFIFNNIKKSQHEIQRYSPNTKMLRFRRNASIDTTIGSNSESSLLLEDRNSTPRVNVGLLAGIVLALLLLIVGQLRTKSGNWSEIIIVHDICDAAIVSAMLCFNWLIAWVLYNYHPFYELTPFTPIEGILFVAAIGYYAWSIFNIVVHLTNGASFSFILKGISRLLLGFIQTFVISKAFGYSLQSHNGNYTWRIYITQSLTFMVVCNAALAFNGIFFETKEITEFEMLFSKRTLTFITSLTHSLEILYFFHSSMCFIDIYFKYQQGTECSQ